MRDMMIQSIEVPTWPKLAWYATWQRAGDTLHVWHGSAVEVRDDRIFEGVWNGRFEAGNFHTATAFSGSGLIVEGDRVTVVPTSFLTEGVFITADPFAEQPCASNSLLCWTQRTGTQLDPSHSTYFADFVEVMRAGWQPELPTLPLASGLQVGYVYLASWTVGPNGGHRADPNPGPGFGPDYKGYKTFLKEALMQTIANAQHADRKTSLRVISTLSTGFDSPAVAALGSELEVKNAITILGRENALAIGKKMGLRVKGKHRSRLLLKRKETVAEFFAYPHGHTKTWAIFEREMTDTIRLTGVGGDSIWGDDYAHGERMEFPHLPTTQGQTIAEHRLRVGFQTIAAPRIGIWHWKQTAAISKGAEMQPFADRGADSRPIARRMGVEAGLTARDFGQKKIAGAIAMPAVFKGTWHRSFEAFLAQYAPAQEQPETLDTEFFMQNSRYRWTLHWAHQLLANRYALPTPSTP